MSDTDIIPSNFLNKSDISREYGMSRVTVNKHLKKLEASGRLIPTTIQQGGRKLYYYDPTDLSVAFESINTTTKTMGTVQRSVSNSQTVSLQHEIELLKKDIAKYHEVEIQKDRTIEILDKNVTDLREENRDLKLRLTDQRTNVVSTAPEPVETEVVPPEIEPDEPKLASLAEIKEAVDHAVKSNEGPEETVEAVDKIEDGTIGPDTEEEPAPTQKKGFWNWIKGY